ncbi:MAG: DUF1887 family protein [Nitrospirae bacterium]|nr:DUF1887 family protein [Nitrospirota bacterium]
MPKDTEFKSHVMFCNATGNNTINMIPALQLGIRSVFIISTEYTEKGLTQRLIEVLKNYKIESKRLIINKGLEKDIISLTAFLLDKATNCEKIAWNISGGQKIPNIAFLDVFRKRIDDGCKEDVILYTEAKPPEIWILGVNYQPEHFRSNADLSLSDILHLYGSTIDESTELYPSPSAEVLKKIHTGRLAIQYFKDYEWFREIFFTSMKPLYAYAKNRKEVEDLVKRSLNEAKPTIAEIGLTMTGYENFVKDMDSFIGEIIKGTIRIEEAQKKAKRLTILGKPQELYNNYWNSIKKNVVERVIENIEHEREKLLQDPVKEEQKGEIISAVRSIGGEIEDISGNIFYKNDLKRLSNFKPGILFEWMVASHIADVIQENDNVKNSIVSIHMGVKTKKAGDPGSKIDTEIDIVITTKFGTLLFFEMKTYEFSGDIVKSKENTAYKKSGPYGKAIMVGPLLKSMVQEKENGEKVYPHYIDGKIKDMKETAEQNNVQYVYIDGIDVMLKKELFCKQ